MQEKIREPAVPTLNTKIAKIEHFSMLKGRIISFESQ